MSDIRILDKWGNPYAQDNLQAQRELASRFGALEDSTPHGMTPGQIENFSQVIDQKMNMRGSFVPSGQNSRMALFDELLPPGRSANPYTRKAQVTSVNTPSSGGNIQTTNMKPYLPEFEDITKQTFPVHRRLANTYWRLFHKTDPVIGPVIDMMSDLPFSDFQLAGEGVDGEVKEAFEYTCTETKLRSKLPHFPREWFVTGEAIPQLHYDSSKRLWNHLVVHNPDQINVVYSPFIKMDPILEYVPDPKLRELATSQHPMLAKVRETMPAPLVSALLAGQNIPLSPINTSFIPRKLHDYELRGTSIISRLWRVLMYEDAVFSASIQTARRAAAPLKLALLGDQNGGIPDKQEEQHLLTLLQQAENDVQGWLVFHNQVRFEMQGNADRLMGINTHYELIERIKLGALGVSKSFYSGEASYQSAAAGLTIFLQRLKALREFFVNEWLIPKFFLPLAQLNKWIKPSKASRISGGQVQVKRSARELREENLYIVPTIEWQKSLDPTVDKERIDAMQALEQNLGIKISDQKKYSCMGLDPEEEQKQIIEEVKFKKDLAGDDPQLQMAIGLLSPEGGLGGGPGGAGGMMSPGLPGEAFGLPGEGDEGSGLPGAEGIPGETPGANPSGPVEALPPEGASLAADEGEVAKRPKGKGKGTGKVNVSTKSKYWATSLTEPLLSVFSDFDKNHLDQEPWIYALKDKEVVEALTQEDPNELWMALQNWLIDENYPTEHIRDLENLLAAQKKITRTALFSQEDVEKKAAELGVSLADSDDIDFLLKG